MTTPQYFQESVNIAVMRGKVAIMGYAALTSSIIKRSAILRRKRP